MCHMYVGVFGDHKSMLDSLELGLQMVVSCDVGAGTEPESSARAVSTLDY